MGHERLMREVTARVSGGVAARRAASGGAAVAFGGEQGRFWPCRSHKDARQRESTCGEHGMECRAGHCAGGGV